MGRTGASSWAWPGSATEAEFQGFIDAHNLTFIQLSDDPGTIYDRFEIPYQPAVVVVRPDGTVETLYGEADEAVLDELIGDAPPDGCGLRDRGASARVAARGVRKRSSYAGSSNT